MCKFLSWIIALTFLVLAVGCGGGKPKDIPVNINPTPKPPTAQVKKEPSPEMKWLSETCTRCHEASELKGLQEKVSMMTAEELQAKLGTMVKGDLKLSEEEIAKAMEIYNAMKAKEAAKKEEAPPA
jgi:cytochrome c553